MRTTRDTVPGIGTVHHGRTRAGQRFCVVVRRANRTLLTFGPDDPDRPAQALVLATDEADQLAELLHSKPNAHPPIRW